MRLVDARREALLAGGGAAIGIEILQPEWLWRSELFRAMCASRSTGGDMELTSQLHARLVANAIDLTRDDLALVREAARRHDIWVTRGIDNESRADGLGDR